MNFKNIMFVGVILFFCAVQSVKYGELFKIAYEESAQKLEETIERLQQDKKYSEFIEIINDKNITEYMSWKSCSCGSLSIYHEHNELTPLDAGILRRNKEIVAVLLKNKAQVT